MSRSEPGGLTARQAAPLVEVEVLKIGSTKPVRVKIAHQDDRYEGRTEWVPGARLKVPWGQSSSLLAREALWSKLIRTGRPELHEEDAAWTVLDHYLAPEVIDLDGGYGVAIIGDISKLLERTGLALADIDHTDAFNDDAGKRVPWNVTKTVVIELMRREGASLLDSERADLDSARAKARDDIEEFNIRRPSAPLDVEAEIAAWETRMRSRLLNILEEWAGPTVAGTASRRRTEHEMRLEGLALLREAHARLASRDTLVDRALTARIDAHLAIATFVDP